MATWNQMSLQDASSPIMQQMTFFHDHTMLIIMMITVLVGYLLISIMITVLVGYLLISIMFNKFINRYLLEGQILEMSWVSTLPHLWFTSPLFLLNYESLCQYWFILCVLFYYLL